MMPLLHHTWTTSVQNTDPNNRSIEELTNALEEEAKRGDPKHSRRIKLLQIRRGSDAHSDYMSKLRETSSVIEYEKMSLDEFLIHLFIRDADNVMAKIAQEILERTTRAYTRSSTRSERLRRLYGTITKRSSEGWRM